MTAPDSRDSCKHFWSQPDTAGMIQCLWCQKVAPAPGQYVTDNTLARGPQQAGGEDVQRWRLNPGGGIFTEQGGEYVEYTDYAALQAALREESARLDYIERTFSGMTNRERYLPVQMIWGKGCNGRTLREACDKYMKRDAALNGGQDDNA